MIPYKHITWNPRDVFVGLLTTLIHLKVYIINLFEKKNSLAVDTIIGYSKKDRYKLV